MKLISPFEIRMFPHQLPFLFLCVLFYCSICFGGTPQPIKCFEDERQALLQFKQGITLTDTCGFLTSWGAQGDCCQWGGIRCDNTTNHVTMLTLPNCDLEGQVSPSLVKLKHLRHLNLGFSVDFQQPIPGFLGSVANLEHLNLSGGFQGEIPNELGNLTQLKTLDLSMYWKSELYVTSLEWLSRLSLLRYLDLSNADLSKATNWMQIVSNLPSLTDLLMNNCYLPAKLSSSPLVYINSSTTLRSISLSANDFNDTSIFEWLFSLPGFKTRLVHLDLSSNQLGGPIPDTFRDMHHLSYLDLSDNNYLQNPVSSKIKWSMPSLSYLDLSTNAFHGKFSNIFSNLCNIETLRLGTNNFTDDLTGVIETVLRCADQVLVTLDLNYNSFSGSIPDTISSFSSMRELYLQGNELTGNITRAIGQLFKLERIDVSSNCLQGSLTSEHFLNMYSLREISSANNHGLVVNISVNWVPPFQLNLLDLGSCKVGPGFPKWLETQKNLVVIDISNAQISDNVPASFWNSLSAILKYLNMSHNQISGVITNLPVMFGSTGAPTVDLSSNLFEGAVPSGFTNAFSLNLNDNRFSDITSFLCHNTTSQVHVLYLSNNLLSGELPDCWMNFDLLISLHLENNQLQGSTPNSIGSLKQLQYLHLYNNSFSGNLPASLENCTLLAVLNLGYNSFTGKIPPSIGHAFPTLGALSLRSTKLSGEIPLSICRLSLLQILDVSVNNISGTIPKCIHNLTAMGEEAVSFLEPDYSFEVYNSSIVLPRYETEIVTWKRVEQRFEKSLRLVKSIDLSSNKLHGNIPDAISSLTGLVSLDLSGNKLSGSIPSEIGNLTALEVLDFSDNHLSGEIPTSLTKLSYLEILGLSNNNLSGEIPRSTQLQGFNASSYTGNHGLCGAPLVKCPRDRQAPEVNSTPNVEDEHDESYGVFPGLYISVVLGFIIGFWGVCGTLVIKRSWRHAYFRLLHNTHDKFCKIVILIAAKTWSIPEIRSGIGA